MAKKLNVKKLAVHAGRVFIIMVVLFFAVYLITILTTSKEFYSQSAERSAKIYFDEDMDQVSELAEIHYQRLYELVDQMKYAQTKEHVDEIIKSYIGSEQFGDLRYYSQGVAYSPTGEVVDRELSGHEMIQALSQSDVAGCTEVYFDDRAQVDCIAFFVPVRGSAYVDGVLSIVPAKDIVSVGAVLQEKTSVVAIIGGDGKVYSSMAAEEFTTKVGTNFYDFMQDFASNKEMEDMVRATLKEDSLSSTEIETKGVKYTVVAEPIAVFDEHLSLVTISVSEGLITTEANYIKHIANILAMTIIAFSVGLMFVFFLQRKTKEALSTANLSDPIIGCANTEGFRRATMDLAYSGGGHRFAIAVLSVRQFHFIEDSMGKETAIDILKFISHTLSTSCTKKETFGYAGDGKFLLLVDYTSESAFRDRLFVLENVVNEYDILVKNKIKLKIAAGLCLSSTSKRRTIPEMIECATIVCEEAKNDVKTPYVIYTDMVRDKITRNEQIEAQMESSLENNEFRLFLQPKYNVAEDRIDSAEALVRWFDPKKNDYIYPAEFISLFEANGFIVKMDHYIYLEVLKFLSNAKEHGDKVIPISVNVSRVTATSADFVNFYVSNKKKYMIDDNLITLEFTESFAMDDDSKLASIINELHNGGIRCSMDDFGVGYSSFSILKEFAMDELKLDRLFLKPGLNAQRDDRIIQTINDLAKEMGMVVVQEGVETKAMFDRVAGMGIGVIQGYYYAKAISVEEFKIFINSNTSIRYKAFVK